MFRRTASLLSHLAMRTSVVGLSVGQVHRRYTLWRMSHSAERIPLRPLTITSRTSATVRPTNAM